MNRHRAIAVLALLGILDSVYLLLAKLGYIGSLSCTISHGCDVVNMSQYSSFLGVPVAAIGLAGYVVLLAIAIAATLPERQGDPRPDRLLALLSGIGLLFTLYLTYAEVFWLHAICQWCVLSQVVILAIFVLAVIGAVKQRRAEA
ncbi:MAG TPA: vitamin K epoxide reductase family protein [Gemmatimonadota bacterium]|nr:vitamin K epoxide reductase family protein [Gemmatimonadota bacterium]